MPMPAILFLKDCQICDASEERIFTDSWTGLEVCSMCLSRVLDRVTMSPASEGDNLEDLLAEM